MRIKFVLEVWKYSICRRGGHQRVPHSERKMLTLPRHLLHPGFYIEVYVVLLIFCLFLIFRQYVLVSVSSLIIYKERLAKRELLHLREDVDGDIVMSKTCYLSYSKIIDKGKTSYINL